MVKHRSFIKLCMRSVRKTSARFISILAIVTVGCGFLAGLTATQPDMLLTADKYYDDHKIYDINIKSTWGLDEEDVQLLRDAEGVDGVSFCHSTDAVMETEDGSCTVRIFDTLGTESMMNGFELIEGRYPENSSECLILVPNKYGSIYETGETFTLSEDDPDIETIRENFSIDKLTAVGMVQSPSYMSIEREISTKGSGSVAVIMYVMPECSLMDVYTDAFVKLSGSAEENCFSDEYKNIVAEGENKLVNTGEIRCNDRYSAEYASAKKELDDGKAEYEDARRKADEEFADAELQLNSAEDELNAALAELDSKETALSAMSAMMPPEQYAAAMAQIDEGRKSIQSGFDSLSEKRSEYEKKKAEAESELSDAQKEIADGEKSLSELEKPEWIITPRTDSMSYSSYESNSDKIAAISKVFPVFFFLVAALVALTTMTRMVDEERSQAGTLKALGFSGASIISYYVMYAASASLIGSVCGSLIGFFTLPALISNAYGMLYSLPRTIQLLYPGTMAVICIISVICTVSAALAACVSQMKECPADLIRPRSPKAGKRIFLERIKPVWKHLGFTKKVAARNIFRYKKRLYMTVIGIAGCMALLVTAFGLRDSIHDIVDKQFGELYKYNLTVYLSDEGDAEGLFNDLKNSSMIDSAAFIHSESGSATFDQNENDVTIYVPKVTDELKENIVLRERIGGGDIKFEEDDVVLTEKLCETLNVKVGDSVTIENADGKSAEFTVTGIAENYVTNFAFIPKSAYEKTFGSQADFNAALVKYAESENSNPDVLASRLLESDAVTAVNFSSTIRESFENTVKSIDYIVIVLIAAAGILAVIVTYNLTNINICERIRELATLKVLGFFDGETAMYIYRETAVLGLIGAAVGCVLGKFLHTFVIRTAEIDSVMFGRSISPVSFILAVVITFAFMLIVNVIMLPKIQKIDMVESMKSAE